MKTIIFSVCLSLVSFLSYSQSNQTNVLQIKRIWEDGTEYPTYTSFYFFPNQPLPKCNEFDVAKVKKEYDENVKHIKELYPNAKFRQVVVQYQPSRHEIELTFEKFKEIICH